MPIRFRCAYCNQLMAISRRKQGTVVRCPKCAGEIIVPSLEGTPGASEEPEPAGDQASAIAEHDVEFAPTVKAPESSRKSSEPRSVALPQRRGVFIPLGIFVTLLIVNLVLIGLAVVVGLLIGKSM